MARHEGRPWRKIAIVGLATGLGFLLRSASRSGTMTAPETLRPPLPAAAGHHSGGDHDFGFEERDTRVATLAWVMVISIVIIASSVAGLFMMIGHLRSNDARHPPLTSEQNATITPPGPALQDDPYRDIAHERQREDALLTTYGWVDLAHTQARIPIDRAITLVIGKSLDPIQ